MKHRVYVDFPKVGLGNLLLVWARGKVFSHMNGLPLVTSAWWGFRWGTWIRRERKKRLYWGYFRESPISQRVATEIRKRMLRVEREPAIQKTTLPLKSTLYCFHEIAPHADLFKDIRLYRDYIKKELINMLKPSLLQRWQILEAPEIGVHIRRGDFVLANPVTPLHFFSNCIQFIRKETCKNLRVTVYSDAGPNELKMILEQENVFLAGKKPDILDLLELSKSRIIITSQSSTFSYWAAFLSDAIVIKPEGDWQNNLRPKEINERLFEGKISFDEPEALNRLSHAIKKEAW